MPSGGLSGIAVGTITAGGFLVYTGIKNVTVQEGMRQILRGDKIVEGPQTVSDLSAPSEESLGGAVGGLASGTPPAGTAKPSASGGRLGMVDIAKYAYNAGFRGEDLATIVAISQVESGGQTAIEDYAHSGHWGLWQIAVTHGYTPEQLKNPATNAAAAYKLYRGRIASGQHPFGDWLPFEPSGAYKSYLSAARDAIRQAGLG